MKLTLLTLLLGANSLMAYYSPKMRTNFGANHATLKVDLGYYSNIYRLPVQSKPDAGTVAPSNGPLNTAMQLNIETMMMVNNRYGFSESLGRSRPTFILGRLNYDGFTNTALATVSYAHSTTCKTNFLFFGQVRGYLSIGVTARMNGTPMIPSDKAYANAGARVGYNVYNENCALQFETYVFHDQVIVNTTAHRKLGNSVLISGGVDNNKPKVGFSVMMGNNCRLSASTRMQDKKNVQAGVNMAVSF
ncbi:MAG TPA: hypothetical protein VGF79_15920 [Bacteroidia bacterium]